MSKRIPVIVVSGFLGSGKTTFLRHLIRKSNKLFGLLINEFGDVGLDGDLVKTCSSCDENSYEDFVIELNNGCICCTVQDDFVPSIKTLLNHNTNLDGIIIETSGLALPMPLLSALNWPEIRLSVYLDMVITLVNGESMLKGLPINNLDKLKNQYNETQTIEHEIAFDELFSEQLEVSDLVLISRADLLREEEFKSVEDIVKKKINPNIPIMKSLNGEIDISILDSDFKKNNFQLINKGDPYHEHNHIELQSGTIKCNYFLEKKVFDKEIQKIIKNMKILRVKGRVWIPNKSLPLQVQIVGTKVNSWFEEAPIDCWRPKNGGTELTMIGFEKENFRSLENKIKEKFNILSDPK